MSVLRRVIFLTLGLLPFTVAAEPRDVVAAAVVRQLDAELQFDDGAFEERRVRRAGIEYWEGVAPAVRVGFSIGYSENESGADAQRGFDTIAGNYGAVGLRVDAPLDALWSLRGRVEYLIERGSRGSGDAEFETRLYETHAELAPVLTYGGVEFALGARVRKMDYRETWREDDGDSSRRAEGEHTSGAFAAIGLRTANKGRIALRYDAGPDDGFALRFEREF